MAINFRLPNDWAAKIAIQVRRTKGIVSELMLHADIALFNPFCNTGDKIEKNINAPHINPLAAKNVGNAHPISVPLNPHIPALC